MIDPKFMLLIAASASCAVSALIVATQRWHGKHSMDHDLQGIQKMHKLPVPRIGGVGLVLGVTVAGWWAASSAEPGMGAIGMFLLKLLLAAAPAMLAGLIEDLTKRVSVRVRLFATAASAVAAIWIVGAQLTSLDMGFVDRFIAITPVALTITVFAVTGLTNAVNIIDGFNGLAAVVVGIMMLALGAIAGQVGDMFVAHAAFVGAGALLGFLLINYPKGLLFLGDGGAYFAGFWLAEMAVLLVARNPVVNAWQVLAICAYPVVEVLFSIYRRKLLRGVSPGQPDRLHLHTLVYRRLVRCRVPASALLPWLQNAMVACVICVAVAVVVVLALWVGRSTLGAVLVLSLQVTGYVLAYRRLVTGRWMGTPRPQERIVLAENVK
jgi:UDP-N-acetylmuramyl pentapeptide phosphotransferase/UDP-N-acetylglucosamine-1-phosphate transferase